VEDLNRPAEKALVRQLSDAAVTLLKGDAESLQLDPLQKTAIVSIGVNQLTVFQQELSRWYAGSVLFNVAKDSPDAEVKALLETLKHYNQVFVSINDTRARPASKLDYSSDVKAFITQIAARNNTVITVFANAYCLDGLPGIEKCGALLVCYQMTDDLQRSAVKVITRQMNPTGRLPVTINRTFTTGLRVAL